LVLVDTGFGLKDVATPKKRLSGVFLALIRPELREKMTAFCQIKALGFDTRDVRHIVLTHLDFDHAGGLDDFPEAEVHLLEQENDAALAQRTILDRMRYRPAQWSTRSNWRIHQRGRGEPWFGFESVRDLGSLSEEIFLVPLTGHTFGHCGVAVKRDRDFLFLAGDAYFHHDEMNPLWPRCPPGLRLYQRMMEKDPRARLWNQDRLRELRREHSTEVTIVCAHDVTEFEREAGRPFDVPAGAEKPRGPGVGFEDLPQYV
jgi:glyoxylase-like metal-dependent hydrolase (beta-lactamase superfamily II)